MLRRQDVNVLLHPTAGLVKPDQFDPETVKNNCLSCEKLRRCQEASNNKRTIDNHVCRYHHKESFPKTVANMAVIGILGEFGKTVVIRKDTA